MGCIDSKFKYEERQANAIAAFVHHAIDGKVDELAKAIKKDRKKVVGIDRFGMTALHWGQLQSVIALCEAGAVPTQVDNNQRNALHHACRKGRLNVVDHLTSLCGMNVNCQSGNGDTPLHKAVLAPSVPVALLLLKYGADKHLPNTYGRTPASEVQTRLGKGNGAATIPEEAEPDLDQVFTLAGGTLPWEDTAVVPFDQTLPQNTTTTLASPRVAASDETPLTSLTGYDLLDAIFSLHDLVLTRDQGATVQFQQLVATHCFVALS
ncbi:hypothetical protein, variant 1 [Aphanomyces invadans]|uniref:Uncharacterized protein n=1 Tax=Aphanomyces invadans TaxID=157072 RepID=A0A024TU55_9STRA|nr:hypothetical protein, variant 1 [Aphanomyces invadans]ETV97514.1 hypothetical protein, variant 1 [Aphanomyces invadans]|eukprot:XP_008873724.1 hypothetical protein, variant 1 [Aphanomyces invadans]